MHPLFFASCSAHNIVAGVDLTTVVISAKVSTLANWAALTLGPLRPVQGPMARDLGAIGLHEFHHRQVLLKLRLIDPHGPSPPFVGLMTLASASHM